MTDAERRAVLELFGLRSLEEATHDTWPWFEIAWEPVRWNARDPYVPDFPTDDAAAVKLAEQMTGNHEGFSVSVHPPLEAEPRWVCCYFDSERGGGFTAGGETIGAALLSALTAAREGDGSDG